MSHGEKYVFALDERDKKYAAEYLNETDEAREAGLTEIRRWLLEENPSLNARLEDKYLLPFLRGCKFNLERTKMKLANYYTMKRDRHEWFRNRDPELSEIQDLVRLGVFVPLKQLYQNRLVVIAKAAAHNPKTHKLDDVCKAGKMILDVAAKDNERIHIYGVTAIFDLSGLSFSHVIQLTPATIKNVVHAWQNDHCKLKHLEFLNAPFHVTVLLNLLKSFMSDKLKARVRVHSKGLEGLHQVVDRLILPPEYGGDGEDVPGLAKYWNNELLRHRDWFAEDELYKADDYEF